MNFGKKILSIRKSKGLTQTTIIDGEREKSILGILKVSKMENALNITVGELLDNELN